jgi:EF hand
MRESVLGVCAAALITAAGFVAAQASRPLPPAQTAPQSASTATQGDPGEASSNPGLRLAAIDTSDEAFRKLDTDHDGRISALEANADPRVAALFPMADKDKDGYLSKEEFRAINTLAAPPDP